MSRRRPRIGLALAGGGPLGAIYEIGALCALQESVQGLDLCDCEGYIGISAGGFIAAGLVNGMTPREIVEAGYEALAGRLRSLAKATEGTERVSEVPEQTGSSDDIRGLKLSGEDHTSGALIQARLLHVTDFAGYYVPHLLDRSIVVRMRVPSGSTARGMLQEACESAADLCETALSEWQKASRN